MYRIYLELKNPPVSFETYRLIFNTHLYINFGYLRSDKPVTSFQLNLRCFRATYVTQPMSVLPKIYRCQTSLLSMSTLINTALFQYACVINQPSVVTQKLSAEKDLLSHVGTPLFYFCSIKQQRGTSAHILLEKLECPKNILA